MLQDLMLQDFVHQPYWPDPTHKEADLFMNSMNKCKGVGFDSRGSLLHSGYIEVPAPIRGAETDNDYALYGQLGFWAILHFLQALLFDSPASQHVNRSMGSGKLLRDCLYALFFASIVDPSPRLSMHVLVS